MGREPGIDHDLAGRCSPARRHTVGPGATETLHLAGRLDGHPVLTFSTPDVEPLGLRPPAPAYVATMARGLRETHDLDDDALVDYLLACRGSEPGWTREELTGAAGRLTSGCAVGLDPVPADEQDDAEHGVGAR